MGYDGWGCKGAYFEDVDAVDEEVFVSCLGYDLEWIRSIVPGLDGGQAYSSEAIAHDTGQGRDQQDVRHDNKDHLQTN